MPNQYSTTIKQWLREATDRIAESGVESARLDCLLLLEFILEKPRDWLFAHDDELLTCSQVKKLDACAQRRADRTPLAYITGSKEFYSRTFSVTKDTLIPRPESEAIIELLKEIVIPMKDLDSKLDRTAGIFNKLDSSLRWNDGVQLPTIYDIGTGSGTLAITAKLEIPHATVIGTDISEEALLVAKKNAKYLGADITFKQANLLPTTEHRSPTIILANLPYVPCDMITSPEILKEPSVALFSGEDGLDHYRAFWQHISELNNKPLAVITESLASQHAQIESLAQKAGYKLEKVTDLIQLFTESKTRV